MSDRRFLERLRDGARELIIARGVAMVNERPIVSFTFDGVPKSAVLNAAPALERRGAAGTFYVSRDFCGATVDGREHYDVDDLRRWSTTAMRSAAFPPEARRRPRSAPNN